MRDKVRIKRIMNKLTKMWEKYPDWRFFQFLINIGLVQDNPRLWIVEDKEVEDFLDKVLI